MPKKKTKPKKPMQRWKLYQVSGNKLERKNKSCPKCGTGTFLAAHKDRLTCGKCKYSEMISSEKK
jgi:small subunit ribosomal protein S27Ae|tara:strand:- start:241 stop:435 length:195 start_codon:yes stop_codon:yes gene_type:complete